MKKIHLSIQEIVNDFYSLAEKEGFISGLAEGFELSNNDKKDYHYFMIDMIDKYLPSWKDKIDKRYWANDASDDEKGVIISTILCENFKEIFYQLV